MNNTIYQHITLYTQIHSVCDSTQFHARNSAPISSTLLDACSHHFVSHSAIQRKVKHQHMARPILLIIFPGSVSVCSYVFASVVLLGWLSYLDHVAFLPSFQLLQIKSNTLQAKSPLLLYVFVLVIFTQYFYPVVSFGDSP